MFSLVPKDKEFFDLFEQAADVSIEAAEAFVELVGDYDRRDELIVRIRECEGKADELTRRTLDKLDQTFVTPFDREDIQALMRLMDDVVDEMDAAAKRLTLYEIQTPTHWLAKQTDTLLQSCKHIRKAVGHLRNLKKENSSLRESLEEIHRLENLGDETNHAAAAELLNGSGDPFNAMKWKEIYDLTEHAINRCEDIANTIEVIELKNS